MVRRIVALATAALGLVWVAGANAGTVVLQGGNTPQFTAAAAEVNNVTVTRVGANFVFTDVLPVTAGAGCAAVTANSVSCPAAPSTGITVNLGDGDDQATIDASVTTIGVSINGQDGLDTITGGDNTEDTIIGDNFGGPPSNDVLTGRGGDDRMIGGPGNDTLDGGPGNEFFDGDPGDDTVTGGDGDDRFGVSATSDGADTLNGGPGRDSIDYRQRTVPLNLTVNGVADDGQAAEGDNLIDIERIDAGEASDTIAGHATADSTLLGGNGDDTITGGSGNDDLNGDDGNDTLNGGDGNDDLNGGRGNDTIDGGAGDDTAASFSSADGADLYRGGAGTDQMSYEFVLGAVTVTLDGTADDGRAGEGDNVATDVEDVIGSRFGDTLIGSAAANVLDGLDGNDTINGAGGADGVVGGRGDDTLQGGPGVDSILAGGGADLVQSRDASADEVACGGGDDRTVANTTDQLRACEAVTFGVAIITATVRARAGRVAVALSCPALEGATCRGTLRLSRSGVLFGTRSFVIPAGARRVATVTLRPAGRAALRRAAAVAMTATARFTDSGGNAAVTTRTIRVRR